MAMTTSRPQTPQAWIFCWLKSLVSSRYRSAHWPYCLTGSLSQPVHVLAIILRPASTKLIGSGGEPDFTGGPRGVTGGLPGPLLPPIFPHKTDLTTHPLPEIATFPHDQNKNLPHTPAQIQASR